MPIYIISAGDTGKVKIGRTKHLQKRLSGLQANNHEQLYLLRVLAGEWKAERDLHKRFGHLRLHSEWFQFDPTMLADVGVVDDIANAALLGPIALPTSNGWTPERKAAFRIAIKAAWQQRRELRAAA